MTETKSDDGQSVKWFGTPWSNRVSTSLPMQPIPIGQPCPLCKQPMKPGDQGLLIPHLGAVGGWVDQPWHISCFRDMLELP